MSSSSEPESLGSRHRDTVVPTVIEDLEAKGREL